MSSVIEEIQALEEQLRIAELDPEASFFEKYLDDEMVFTAAGNVTKPKQQIVEAHGKEPKFNRFDIIEMTIIDQVTAAVVTCEIVCEGPTEHHVLRFMRVWAKKPEGWKIIAVSML